MEFSCSQISLFLTALLQLTGAAAGIERVHHIIRLGDDVTLSCGNVIKNQPECNSTVWHFRSIDKSAAVELVTDGKFNVNAGAQSDKLSVKENCSLLIKNFTFEDYGYYTCQQVKPKGRQVPDADYFLSPLTMFEGKDRDKLTFYCIVWTDELFTPKVKWVYEGKDMKGSQDLVEIPVFSIADVTFQLDHFIRLRNNSLQCEVTVNNKTYLFPFSQQTSVEDNNQDNPKTTVPETAQTTPASENKDATDVKKCRCCSGLDYLMLALRVVELILIPLIIVLLFRAQGRQRPHDVNVDWVREDSTANYENVGRPSASVHLQ